MIARKRLIRHLVNAAGEEGRGTAYHHRVGSRLYDSVAMLATVINGVVLADHHLAQPIVSIEHTGSDGNDTGWNENLLQITTLKGVILYPFQVVGKDDGLQGNCRRRCLVVLSPQ